MVYLDNSATTKPFPEVLQTFVQVSEQYYANPASIHQAGTKVNELLQRAREQLGALLHTEAQNILFTSGGTESNNFVIFSVAKTRTHIGKHIITSKIEHPSVLQAMKLLEQEGFDIDYIAVDEDGVVQLDELKEKLRKDTILVSIMHVNNEIGAIQPIEQIAKFVHQHSRAFVHVDAVQSFGKLAVQFAQENGPDFITVSAHKIHGVKGSGFVAMRQSFEMKPLLVGGGQEFGLRSGTVAVPQAVACAKAARLAIEKMDELQYKTWHLDIMSFLKQYDGQVKVLSNDKCVPYIIAFSVKDLKGEVLINALQEKGVIVSTSSACSSKLQKVSHVIEALRVDEAFKFGVLRVSMGAMTEEQDILQFKRAFQDVMYELKGE